jgi:hypothetical protein
MALVALPGAYAPVSIALRVIRARKPSLHQDAVVLEEEFYNILENNPSSNFLKSKDTSTVYVNLHGSEGTKLEFSLKLKSALTVLYCCSNIRVFSSNNNSTHFRFQI